MTTPDNRRNFLAQSTVAASGLFMAGRAAGQEQETQPPVHQHSAAKGAHGDHMPEPSWYPSNNVLVGVAQAREIEFIANNPGDWILHCHMFHHMMNSMTSQAGPLVRKYSTPEQMKILGYPQIMLGMEMPDMKGMKMPGMDMKKHDMKDMPKEAAPKAAEPSPKKSDSPHDHEKMQHEGHTGMSDDKSGGNYGMEGMARVEGRRAAMGMRPGWSMGVESLSTVVRVLPPEMYKKIAEDKGLEGHMMTHPKT